MMNEEKLSAILAVLNPAVIQIIMETKDLDSIEAVKLFYNSEVYAMLENEASKLWHLSPLTLYELLREELSTGTINYPEEA
jgi:hypothetical protein